MDADLSWFFKVKVAVKGYQAVKLSDNNSSFIRFKTTGDETRNVFKEGGKVRYIGNQWQGKYLPQFIKMVHPFKSKNLLTARSMVIVYQSSQGHVGKRQLSRMQG